MFRKVAIVRKSILFLLLTLLLSGMALSETNERRLVSQSFKRADLVHVFKVLAKAMGAKARIGPSVQGSVSIKLVDATPREALRRVLALQQGKFAYRILLSPELTLVVDTPEALAALEKATQEPQETPAAPRNTAQVSPVAKSADVKVPADSIRMEYLLEEAPSAKVLEFLKPEYTAVKFTPHPTMNGFFARGSREDLLQIKRELGNLDRVPEPPSPPLREYLPVKYGDVNEIRALLGNVIPDVQYNVDSRQSMLIVEGAPGRINEVREMLSELSLPIESSLAANHPTPTNPTETIAVEQRPSPPVEAESYEASDETEFRRASQRPLSTFSIDVDTASYANVRRFLKAGQLPPVDAIRLEELINYFNYDYPEPKDRELFSITTELTSCPWKEDHQLLRVGLQGRRRAADKAPPRNLVFLLDVSGSMDMPNKLPLVKKSMQLLLQTLGAEDSVALVIYAGSEGLVLPSTPCSERELISAKMEDLNAGGSTHGSAGIQLAYDAARENFQKGAINRVILCTDGDFNVGLTGGALTRLIEREREDGIFLTVLGFGTGNIKDDTLEMLADKGNGNYAYVDSLMEAEKVLVREADSTLETIAKDVKLQIEFNPKRVHSYRLIGYENRRLKDEDFNNDKKDAGELGAGHNVTALYEIVAKGKPAIEKLRYQNRRTTTDRANDQELASVKLRYKRPNGKKSKLIETIVKNVPVDFEKASRDTRFASSVVAFGQVLRGSKFRGTADLAQVVEWARKSVGDDPHGDRHEFLKLIRLADSLLNMAARR